MRRKGFTLMELLVVIIIIIILASVTVALLNVFFRGQGCRQGAMVVTQAVAQAKQLAADKRTVHFVVFTNQPDGGVMRIYQDTGTPPDKQYGVGDIELASRAFPLPKYVEFVPTMCPSWVGVEPSGYCLFSSTSVGGGGFTETPASNFEAAITTYGGGGGITCDILLRMQGRPFMMALDVDSAGGKVRRSHFLAQ